MLSPLQHTLLRRLRASSILEYGPLDSVASRKGLQARGLVRLAGGRVDLTEKGRAMFGAAFQEVPPTLSEVHRATKTAEGTWVWSPFPAEAISTLFRLTWSAERGEILFARQVHGGPWITLWAVSDLVDTAGLVHRLREAGTFFMGKKNRVAPDTEPTPG